MSFSADIIKGTPNSFGRATVSPRYVSDTNNGEILLFDEKIGDGGRWIWSDSYFSREEIR